MMKAKVFNSWINQNVARVLNQDILKSCRRSRSSQQRAEPVSRPAQDILIPPTTNSPEEEEDMKATGCYSTTDRNQQKPDIALDFLILLVFVLSLRV